MSASASLATIGVPFAQRSKHHSRLSIVTLRPTIKASLVTVGSSLSAQQSITHNCRSSCPSLRDQSITRYLSIDTLRTTKHHSRLSVDLRPAIKASLAIGDRHSSLRERSITRDWRSSTLRPAIKASLAIGDRRLSAQRSKHHSRLAIVDSPPSDQSITRDCPSTSAQRSKHHSRLSVVTLRTTKHHSRLSAFPSPRERSITRDCRVATLRPEIKASLVTVGSSLSAQQSITHNCRSSCPSLRDQSITRYLSIDTLRTTKHHSLLSIVTLRTTKHHSRLSIVTLRTTKHHS